MIFSLTWKPSLWPGGLGICKSVFGFDWLIIWDHKLSSHETPQTQASAGMSSHFGNLGPHFYITLCNSDLWLLNYWLFLSVTMRWDAVPLNQVLINYLWRVIQNWFGFCCLFVSRFLINLHRPARALEPGLHCIVILLACNLVTAFKMKTRHYKESSSL